MAQLTRLPQRLLQLLLLLPLFVHAQEPITADGDSDIVQPGILPAATPSASPPSILTIAIVTTLMAAATGLGAAPFFYIRQLNPRLAALANTVASGVMLACSFDLIHEGQPHGPAATIAGVVLGALFISYSQRYLEGCDDPTFDALKGADARKALLMVGVMTLHAFGEGSGVGVSFAGSRGWSQGTLVSVAIGLHNVPEGLAVASVMASRGTPPARTLLWTLATALPQPLVAVPSFMFVNAFATLLPLALGFAAGCMVWIVMAELVPEALQHLEPQLAATSATFSAAGLEGLRMLVVAVEAASQSASGSATLANSGLGALQAPFDWAGATKSLLELVTLLLLPTAAASALASAAGAQLLGGPARLGAATGAMAAAAAAGVVRVVMVQGVSLGGIVGWGCAGAAGLAGVWWVLGQRDRRRGTGGWLQAEVASKGGAPAGAAWPNGNGAVPVNAHANGHHWSLQLPSSPSKHAAGEVVGRNGFVAAAAAKLSMQGSAELPYSSKARHASGPLAALRRAASLGAACLAVQCVAPGLYAAAFAVQADTIHDVSQLGPPLALIGLILGTITLGLVGALAPHPPALPPLRALIALAATPAAALVAAAAAVRPHLAEGDVEAIAARLSGAGHRWTVAAAAAALPCCLLWLWPAARTTRPHAAAAGLVLGVLVGCFASVGVELLCAGTPYCLFVASR